MACSIHKNVDIGIDDQITDLDRAIRNIQSRAHATRTNLKLWGFGIHVRDSKSVGTVKENLKIVGLVATFFAGVQPKAITSTTPGRTTHLQVAASALFIAGMLLDVLGACFAFIAIVHLEKLHALLVKRDDSYSAIMAALQQRISASAECDPCHRISILRHNFQSIEMFFQCFLGDAAAWKNQIKPLEEAVNRVSDVLRGIDSPLMSTVHPYVVDYRDTGTELSSLRRATHIAYVASVAVPLIIGTGVTCFVVGSLCFVKDTMPVEVWATALSIVCGIVLVVCVIVGGPGRTPAPLHMEARSTPALL